MSFEAAAESDPVAVLEADPEADLEADPQLWGDTQRPRGRAPSRWSCPGTAGLWSAIWRHYYLVTEDRGHSQVCVARPGRVEADCGAAWSGAPGWRRSHPRC